jgi:hypothetical protein
MQLISDIKIRIMVLKPYPMVNVNRHVKVFFRFGQQQFLPEKKFLTHFE